MDTGEIVAIKMIPLTESDEMESIQKEIAMLRDCNHPNIVKYYGSWRAPDALWIAMEYCAGGSVSDIMHALDSPLEETVISYICGEALAGLSYLHAQGRVHRDIKCGNILLTGDGEVKLADFGVAAQLTSTLSKRNTFIGTPHWMAPEVIQASHYDGKVDVWALGICSIEMAERYPPRWRVNPNRVIFMIVRDPPPRLAEKEAWTLSFQDFIAQCLTKDPRSRPTARYLQSHKFIVKDKTAAIRSLLPLLHRATTEYAMLAAAAAATTSSFAPTASDDGYFSWRRDPMHDTLLVAGRPSSGVGTGVGGSGTLSGTVVVHNSSGVRDGGGRREDVSGTLIVKNIAQSSMLRNNYSKNTGERVQNISATVVASSSDAGLGGRRRDGAIAAASATTTTTSATTTVAAIPSTMHTEASADYLAAVHSADVESLDVVEYHRHHHYGQQQQGQANQDAPLLSSPYEQQQQQPNWQFMNDNADIPGKNIGNNNTKYHRDNQNANARGNEMQRMIERLYTIHSSGEVVPLPFIPSTDMAPLALLGMEGGGTVDANALRVAAGSQGELAEARGVDWKAALMDVYAETQTTESFTAMGKANATAGDVDGRFYDGSNVRFASTQDAYHALPAVLVSRVESSPILMNMATALARHKAALAEQELHGVSQRKLEPLKRKADALSDTLKTILCL